MASIEAKIRASGLARLILNFVELVLSAEETIVRDARPNIGKHGQLDRGI